jgi:hypothetical protein
MVHHSIAVVITSFLTNFSELRHGEVRRISLPRTPVNKGKKGKGASYATWPFSSSFSSSIEVRYGAESGHARELLKLLRRM